jgi:hypothetical protein
VRDEKAAAPHFGGSGFASQCLIADSTDLHMERYLAVHGFARRSRRRVHSSGNRKVPCSHTFGWYAPEVVAVGTYLGSSMRRVFRGRRGQSLIELAHKPLPAVSFMGAGLSKSRLKASSVGRRV